MAKSNKPVFSDRVIVGMMELDKKTLKKVLGNMSLVLKTTAKNNIRIVPMGSDNDLDLNEIVEAEPESKEKRLEVDVMFQ